MNKPIPRETLDDLLKQLKEVRKRISDVVIEMDSAKSWRQKALLQENVLTPLDKQRFELLQKIRTINQSDKTS
jgi:hypothetical protein